MLGEKIRELREERGILQRELASELKLGEGFLSKVEHGQKFLSKTHLRELSRALDFPLKDLELLWLASKVHNIIENEQNGMEVLKIIEKQLRKSRK